MAGGHGGFGTDNWILAASMVSFCITMVGVFASSEASILAANKIRLQQLADKGDKRALAFCELRENEDKMFATILAVENMFIIFAASFGQTSMDLILKKWGYDHLQIPLFIVTITVLAFVPFVLEFFIVLFGEITPKTYAARHATRVALIVSRPLRLVVNILYPLIKYTFVLPSRFLMRILDRIFGTKEHGPSITEEELRMMIDRGSQEGVFEEDERDLLHNVFEFSDTVVTEVMTNRTKIIAFDIEQKIEEVLPEIQKHDFSQYPVYGDSIDDIRGIVFLKDLLKAWRYDDFKTHTLERYLRPALYVPKTKNIAQLLEMMQTNKLRAVIVADEYGGTEGLVTLNDILNELVNIEDQNSPLETFISELAPQHFRIQGQTPLYDVNESLDLDLPEGQYQTIAGFVLSHLGHIPRQGEIFQYENLEIKVTQTLGPKILELHLLKSGNSN